MNPQPTSVTRSTPTLPVTFDAPNKAAQFVIAALVIAGLYVARDILIPIALAVFFSFILAPLVRALRARRIPRVPAVLSIVLAAFLLLTGVTVFVGHQLSLLADNLPRYETTIRGKIDNLKAVTSSNGLVARLSNALRDIGTELSADNTKAPSQPPATATQAEPAPKPMLVEIQEHAMTPMQAFRAILTPALGTLGTAGLVLLFVIFILLQREDLRDRMIRLTGTHDLNRSTSAIDDAASRLSRLFLMQTVINVSFGIVIAAGLWIIGVPGALVWGILAALLRFVPYIGALISAAFPIALAAAVDPGWQMVGLTVLLFAVSEPLVGHGLEPLLQGRSTGLSPIAIIVSATFWTWLWGPIGLILSTPLTVCLTSLGRHVEGLAFFDVLFGAAPALSPPQKFYQRMLANDPAEAASDAEDFMEERSLVDYYDAVALPATDLASTDLRAGKLSGERFEIASRALDELIDELNDVEDPSPPVQDADTADSGAAALPPGPPVTGSVLCLPGRSAFDRAACAMLVQALGRAGITATAPESDASPTTAAGRPALICVSYFGARFSATHNRFLLRRIHRQHPDVEVIACLWTGSDGDDDRSVNTQSGETIVRTMREAVDACRSRLAPRPVIPDMPKSEQASSLAAQ